MSREIIKSRMSRANRGQQHKKYQDKIMRVGSRFREQAADETYFKAR